MNENLNVSTLVQLLRHRARHQPDRRAYTLLAGDDSEEICLTYGELDQQARAISARLQRLDAAGERVLLLYPTSLEYITAFFGCLYAGAVPIPAYPPRRNRPDLRIQAIATDAQAAIALTTTSMLPELQRRIERSPDLTGLHCLGTSYPEPPDGAEIWEEQTATGDSLAYIQYTSGSTASPKGVMLSHSNLLHMVAQLQEAFMIKPEGMGVSWLPLYHDMGLIGGILLALYTGGPLTLLSAVDFAQNPLRWLKAITDCKATVSGGPGFAYQLCVDRITPEERATLDLGRWRVAFCGAEPIDAEVLDRFSDTFAPCGFHAEAFCPSYGLAEATLAVSAKVSSTAPAVCTVDRSALEHGQVVENGGREHGQALLSCGQVLPGQQVRIVDPESLAQCPPDRIGEIWVSGPSVGQGYWNRPEETARAFQTLLADTGEGPFLRTGDLGFMKDGDLYITGRLKDLIIIRGLNYDPHDIESTAQRSHPTLQPNGGAAFSLPVNGEERLVILHELRRIHRKANVEEIAKAIRHAIAEEQELPVYAVALVKPGAMPRTSSGKIQRYLCRTEFMAGRLEASAISRLENPLYEEQFRLHSAFVAPRTPVEMALVGIWAEVLNLQRIGIEDNFFELGGQSLMATQVVSRLREVFQVDLALRSLFEAPTIAGLAAQVERALRKELEIPPVEPVARDGPLPLSFAQERMWFLHQLDPWNSAYSIPGALRLVGPLDRKALEQTLHDLVRRHEAFRTTFSAVGGQPVQVISPPPESSLETLDVIDLRWLPQPERESRALQRIQEEARRPFDLTSGPLLRVLLLQTDDEEHILLFSMHHIISDAWSLGLLTDEVLKLYNSHASGESVHLPALPIQYADFAVWQRQWLPGKALEALLAYWRKQLAGIQSLELPTDHPRPVMQRYRGGARSADMSEDLLEGLKRLSNREGVTLFMTLLAAFQVLLHRYTGQEDIAVGVPIANRNWLEIEGVVGSFVNTLVMRTDLSGNPTVRELLHRVREVALDAYAHQDMPYAKLVAELQPERDTSRAPLAQVMFNVLNVAMPPLQLKDLHAVPLEVDRQGAQFDLTLTVADNDFMPQISIEYNTDLLTANTARRMLGHFRSLLEGIAADPGQPISALPMLTEAERQQLVVAWNDTAADYPEDATIVELFEAQVERTPNATAFLFEGQELSYGALNRRANQLAHYLQSRGVGPEVTVGVFLERSLDMTVCLLGILKAGGAYLPLDPGYPQERLTFMLRDAGASVLLIRESLTERMPQHEATVVCLDTDRAIIDRQSTRNPASGTDADSLAYVLYTSGSTGRPKGALGPHRGALNLFAWMRQTYPFQAREICCQRASVSFVDSVWELFGPLLQGIPTAIIPDSVVGDPHQLVRALAANHVTRIVVVPSLLQAVLDAHNDLQHRLPDLRICMCGSEPLPVDLARRFREMLPQCTLLNLWGCSETTAFSVCYDTAHLSDDRLSVPIGHPIANTQIYLLDSHLNPVPVGIPGEIYVGGAGLARGYLNNPELTAQRFVPDPFSSDPAAHLYRTGDLARYQPDGNIDYLGRRDHQVKIRGFRIELGEIEAALRQHPAVTQAAVIVTEQGGSTSSSSPGADRRLVAFLTTTEDPPPSPKELGSFLGGKLPTYMVPSAFVFLDALPLNPNGKTDRQVLAKLGGTGSQGQAGFVAPQDETQRQLVQIWEEVLGAKPLGIRDNFFDLGGHSLLAMRLFARIKEVLGTELPVASLFQAPTVEQLAETIRQSGALPDWSVLVPIQPDGSQAPLFCVHGIGGGVLGYAELAQLLGPEQPVYGLQARGLEDGDSIDTRIEDMASHNVEAMRSVQPHGPYCLGGYSFGGVVALETARQLKTQGEQVALLALFDTYAPYALGVQRPPQHPLAWIGFLRNAPLWLRDLLQREDGAARLLARIRLTAQAARLRLNGETDSLPAEAALLHAIGNTDGIPEQRRKVILAHLQAMESYRPQVYPGRVTLFRVRGMRLFRTYDTDLGWGKLAAGGVEVQMVPGAHYNILEKPGVDVLAAKLKASLARAQAIPPDDQTVTE